MTTLPDLDPAAVRAACMANFHPDAEPSATELARMEKSIRAYLSAARSAPEAGAAIDWKRVDDALVSCAGLLKTLCRDEIGDTCAAELEYVRSALAARSVPEAGKAVVKPLEWFDPSPPKEGVCHYDHCFTETSFGKYQIEWKSWKDYPSFTIDGPNGYFGVEDTLDGAKLSAQADYEQRILSALASVAPSGAEPIGWQWKTLDTWHTIDKSSVADPEAYARTQAGGGQYRPIYAAPQAVPAEDVANLITSTEAELAAGSLSAMDWNTQSIALVRRLLAALTSISTIAEERRSMSLEWKNACERSEAEATSLRRKLEEARKALEPFHAYASLPSFERLHADMQLTPGSGMAARQVTVADFRRAAEVYRAGASE